MRDRPWEAALGSHGLEQGFGDRLAAAVEGSAPGQQSEASRRPRVPRWAATMGSRQPGRWILCTGLGAAALAIALGGLDALTLPAAPDMLPSLRLPYPRRRIFPTLGCGARPRCRGGGALLPRGHSQRQLPGGIGGRHRRAQPWPQQTNIDRRSSRSLAAPGQAGNRHMRRVRGEGLPDLPACSPHSRRVGCEEGAMQTGRLDIALEEGCCTTRSDDVLSKEVACGVLEGLCRGTLAAEVSVAEDRRGDERCLA
eukprot:scaffold139975_cov127-Phaeocystis_antarctica.AAC.4